MNPCPQPDRVDGLSTPHLEGRSMTEFTASNGIKVNVISDGQAEIVYPKNGTDSRALVTWARPDEMAALREFFAHEASKQPWDDAQRGDVWLFSNESDSQRALGWRGPTDWDAIDPKGNFHSSIADVPAEMESHGLYGWDKPQAKLIYRIGDAS